ncbi:hypothetical protein [Bacillus coahuilensis]|uniref:hypothetical protein n=1 Tax=Bacillus coahuilensis TaxID=408580 RepID=UPI0001850ADC|nr:hypothetical protein [Bacillus coahuilensis]
MQKKTKNSFLPDTEYEGKEKAYLDEDRFINEGMAGGSVFRFDSHPNIDESLNILVEEEPPNK